MSSRPNMHSRREELLAQCRHQRASLTALADEAVARSHARDLLQALRFARRVVRLFTHR